MQWKPEVWTSKVRRRFAWRPVKVSSSALRGWNYDRRPDLWVWLEMVWARAERYVDQSGKSRVRRTYRLTRP